MKHSPSPLPPLDTRQRYDLDEAARYLRISRSTLYNDIAAGLTTAGSSRSSGPAT
jgi:hypothetical protein